MSRSQPETTRDTYHHGDLRQTLIAAGVAMLDETGPDALSLRALARRAGVSHNAPYQHFADKEALVAAIAEQGFAILSDAMDARQRAAAAEPAGARLLAAGQSYVDFALGHPNHFQVMFSRLPIDRHPALASAARDAFERLVAIVAAGQAEGELRDGRPETHALAFWTAVHGLSAILAADKLPSGVGRDAAAGDLVAAALEPVIRGLRRETA